MRRAGMTLIELMIALAIFSVLAFAISDFILSSQKVNGVVESETEISVLGQSSLDDLRVYDHALSRPWTLHKQAVRTKSPRPVWYSEVCSEHNAILRVGKEAYFLSADGFLMPSKKDQPPPDPRYFNQRK